MPKKHIQEQPNITRGRPLGSKNRFPQLLRQLVLNAATMSGFPTEKWIIEEDVDSEGNVIWVEVTDPGASIHNRYADHRGATTWNWDSGYLANLETPGRKSGIECFDRQSI